jgi:hypothetical protein
MNMVPPDVLENPSGRFQADERHSVADAMFRRTYDERINAVANDPQKLADFESREHAQVFETRKNADGMTLVYPITDLISGKPNNAGIHIPAKAFTPNSFVSTHSHFGPTRADRDPSFYDTNHWPSPADQRIAHQLRNEGLNQNPAGQHRYETMFNPHQNKMLAYDGKLNPNGKMEYFE